MEAKELEPVNHYAPDEPRARALALVELGHTNEDAAAVVGVSGRTVGRWIERSQELSENKPILDRWRRVTLQAQDLIRDGLDNIEEDESGQSALKHLKELNFIAGTGTDKLQKDTTPTVTVEKVLIVVNAARPDEQEPIVEARVVDDENG